MEPSLGWRVAARLSSRDTVVRRFGTNFLRLHSSEHDLYVSGHRGHAL